MLAKDYGMIILLMTLVLLISGCAASPATHETWQTGWCNPLGATPQTDL